MLCRLPLFTILECTLMLTYPCGQFLIFLSRKFDHVTPLLRELHWLSFTERINYKLALLVFKDLNGLAPPYLACEFHRVANTRSCKRLRSGVDSGTHKYHESVAKPSVVVLSPVVAVQVWNSLPSSATTSQSLKVNITKCAFSTIQLGSISDSQHYHLIW